MKCAFLWIGKDTQSMACSGIFKTELNLEIYMQMPINLSLYHVQTLQLEVVYSILNRIESRDLHANANKPVVAQFTDTAGVGLIKTRKKK